MIATATTRLVLASSNAGKLREFSALLAPLAIEVVAQSTLGVSDAEEPHQTFIENALAKARHASAATGLPALADDSGICVAALGGRPGVHSARYASLAGGARSDEANNAKLIRDLDGIRDRRASYVCLLVLVRHAEDPTPIIAESHWQGEVLSSPQGEGGFGYDPYFWLPEWGCTAAQLAPAQKNAVSHRGRAVRALLDLLRTRGGLVSRVSLGAQAAPGGELVQRAGDDQGDAGQ